MKNIVREVFDAVLLIVILAGIAFLVYYLQLPPEQRPPVSDLIPGRTESPDITHTITPAPALVYLPSATRTGTATVTPRTTTTPSPTRTPTRGPVSTATALSTAATPLTVELEIANGIEQGVRIVEAIEAYARDRGFHPATLEALVPSYLPQVPVTITGQEYFYRIFERTTVLSSEIYWVSFRVTSQSNVICTYYRRLESWDCNFSSP